MTELTAIGREEMAGDHDGGLPELPVWGPKKRNSTLWYADNFVGTELDNGVSYARIADACGLKGVQAGTMDALTDALNQALKDQAAGTTTLIEALINPGAGRALPPRCHESAGGCRGASIRLICRRSPV